MLNLDEVEYNKEAMSPEEVGIAIVGPTKSQVLPITDSRFCTFIIGDNEAENRLVYMELIDFLLFRSGDKRRYILNVFYDPSLGIAKTLAEYFRRALSLTPEKIMSENPLQGENGELAAELWENTRSFMLSGII